MASLRRRAGGWDLRYRERDGRERTERFRGGTERRPPAEALDRKAEVESALRRGTYVSREQREVTFAVYYERWAAARQISATRRYTDEQRAAKHVLPHWGNWPICEIRPSDIDDWVALLSRRMGPRSVRTCYGLLRGPLRRAVKDRVITDPCIEIALPKLRSLPEDVRRRPHRRGSGPFGRGHGRSGATVRRPAHESALSGAGVHGRLAGAAVERGHRAAGL